MLEKNVTGDLYPSEAPKILIYIKGQWTNRQKYKEKKKTWLAVKDIIYMYIYILQNNITI